MTLDRTVGIPPSTITQKEYCLAKRSVLPLAPKSPRTRFIKSSIPIEKKAVVASARWMLKAETFPASSGSPAPRRREIRAPPPIPDSPARERQILNTGRIRDTPATIYGFPVRPR